MDVSTMQDLRDDEVADNAAEASAAEGAPRPRRPGGVARAGGGGRGGLGGGGGAGGRAVADIEGRLPGRGLWITPSRAAIGEALRKKLIARAARRQVEVPADLADRIEVGLLRRCLDLLGLARRAGQAVTGYEKVRARLKDGAAGLLIGAADASGDGRRKLRNLAAATSDGRLPLVEVLSATELGAALGRENAVHVALAPGRLAERLRDEAARLAGMRMESAVRGVASADKKNDRNET